jgi:hypothetical protein
MQALRVRKTQLSVLGEGETGRLKDSRGTAETGRRGDQQTKDLATAERSETAGGKLKKIDADGCG